MDRHAAPAIVGLFFFIICGTFAYGAGERLAAPLYPGAVPFPKETMTNTEVFLARGAHDKVEAFYLNGHARKAKDSEVAYKSPTSQTLVAMDANAVAAVLKKAGLSVTLINPARVRMEWRPEMYRQLSAMSRLLMWVDLMGKKDKAAAAEAPELRKKYSWAELAFFVNDEDQKIEQDCRMGEIKLKPEERLAHNKGCLEKLAAAAYPTKLYIDRSPETWK